MCNGNNFKMNDIFCLVNVESIVAYGQQIKNTRFPLLEEIENSFSLSV